MQNTRHLYYLEIVDWHTEIMNQNKYHLNDAFRTKIIFAVKKYL